MEIKVNKQNTNKTKKCLNETKWGEKRTLNSPTEFVLCCPTTPGHRACMEVCLMYPERLHWEKPDFFPLLVVLTADNFLVRYGNLCPLPYLSAGKSCLNLYRSWTCLLCPCGSHVLLFCCVGKTLFAWSCRHLWLLQSFLLLFHIASWTLRGGLWWGHSI